MSRAAELLINSIDWGRLRSLLGGSESVPSAFRELVAAQTDEAADKAYWKLDNRIVVQGQLFEAAQYLVGPLLVVLRGDLSAAARHRVIDLLVEIALASPDVSEAARGNVNLGDVCRDEIRRGLWCIYSLLDDPEGGVRVGAIDLLDAVETERSRFTALLSEIAKVDEDPVIQRRATEIL